MIACRCLVVTMNIHSEHASEIHKTRPFFINIITGIYVSFCITARHLLEENVKY